MSTKEEEKSNQHDFGILQVVTSHEADVRAVSAYPGGGVLTASRDNTAKLYQPDNPSDRHSELHQVQTFTGPTRYASSICYGKTKSGEIEIYVGSHDSIIFVYTMMESKPVTTLSRHSKEVSSLAFRVCNDQDVLVSGDWDGTTIIWQDKEPKFTLIGHMYAVWAVAFVARSFILTGGADKTIRKWNISDGSLLNIWESHTECVRGLAVISGQHFLSCSNDTTVKLWSISGEVLKTFEGHENFIYNVCVVREPLKPGVEPPKNRPYKFVTVSEDKTVRVWDKDEGCVQKIPLEVTTLWSVAALDNGNFIVGTSAGFSYIFSHVNETKTKSGEDLNPSTSKSE